MGTTTDILKSLRSFPSVLNFAPVGSFYVLEAQDETASTSADVEVKVVGGGNGNGRAEPTMSPPKTIPYRGSGGDSERREYADGEGVTIESQDYGYVLAWSAQIGAPDFLRIASRLVDAKVKIEVGAKSRTKSLPKALRLVTAHPEVDAIEINAGDETLMWSRSDPFAGERHDLTRVTMAFSVLDSARVEGLIADTAATQIKGDLAGIAASVEHLTHATSSVAAA